MEALRDLFDDGITEVVPPICYPGSPKCIEHTIRAKGCFPSMQVPGNNFLSTLLIG